MERDDPAHSIAQACLVGLLVMAQAYVLTGMVLH
jgi:hypothetical protein